MTEEEKSKSVPSSMQNRHVRKVLLENLSGNGAFGRERNSKGNKNYLHSELFSA